MMPVDGNGSEDGVEDLVAGTPKVANGEGMGTLVKPETIVLFWTSDV
jgi:hypothetical protein